jgi:hypothetical protein
MFYLKGPIWSVSPYISPAQYTSEAGSRQTDTACPFGMRNAQRALSLQGALTSLIVHAIMSKIGTPLVIRFE